MRLCFPIMVLCLPLATPASADLLQAGTSGKGLEEMSFADVPPTNIEEASITELIDWLSPTMRLLGSFSTREVGKEKTATYSLENLGIAWRPSGLHLSQRFVLSGTSPGLMRTESTHLLPEKVDIDRIAIVPMSFDAFFFRDEPLLAKTATYETVPIVDGKTACDGRTLYVLQIPVREGEEGFRLTSELFIHPLLMPVPPEPKYVQTYEIPFIDAVAAGKVHRALSRLLMLHGTGTGPSADEGAPLLEAPPSDASLETLGRWLTEAFATYGEYSMVTYSSKGEKRAQMSLTAEVDVMAGTVTFFERSQRDANQPQQHSTTIYVVPLADLDPASLQHDPFLFGGAIFGISDNIGMLSQNPLPKGHYGSPPWYAASNTPKLIEHELLVLACRDERPAITVKRQRYSAEHPQGEFTEEMDSSIVLFLTSRQAAREIVAVLRRLCESAS